MNRWNTFVRATFAQCRAQGITPWAGGHPMAWAAELYCVYKDQADELTRPGRYISTSDIIDEIPNPEELLIAAEAVVFEDDITWDEEPLYRPHVDAHWHIPQPAWRRDPEFFMIASTRQRLLERAA